VDRRNNAKIYLDLLKEVDGVILPKINKHLFVIQVDNRDDVVEALKQMGISTGLHYPIPLHLQKAYKHMKLAVGSFPVAELCAKRLLSLPMFPELTKEQIVYVCDCLGEILKE
jgi:dTDP-4-amino-4,6-dideoxygalactose transaminase